MTSWINPFQKKREIMNHLKERGRGEQILPCPACGADVRRSELAAEITAALAIPTIGIGAGPVCDAQWLVMHDLLGLNERVPSFAKKYADLATTVRSAFATYVGEVKNGQFPPPCN